MRWVLVLGTLYLVLVLLLVLLENWLVYLPRSAEGSWSNGIPAFLPQ